jgi:hypothetical protein
MHPFSIRTMIAVTVGDVDRLQAANRGPGDRALDSVMRNLANLETQLHGAADQLEQREYERIDKCQDELHQAGPD